MLIRSFPALAAAGLLRAVAPAFRLRDERPRDAAAREALLDASFGPSRFAKTCERLREGRVAAEDLSLVAVDGTRIGRHAALLARRMAAAARPSCSGRWLSRRAHRSAGIGRRP